MSETLEQTLALLARTPSALNALLRPLPEPWTHRTEGGQTWSAYDVIGHLVDGERTDWMPRVRSILQFGSTCVFPPIDRWAHRSGSGLAPEPLEARLDQLTALREQNLKELRDLRLGEEDLKRRGRHPDFGEVTLSQLLAAWAAHDMTHLHQISRVLAHQYRDAVGPFQRYLGVLQCQGHSAPPGPAVG